MYSAQVGIFPFQNNIGDFFGAVVAVGGLVALTIAILLSRHSSLVQWKTISGPGSDRFCDTQKPAGESEEAEKRPGSFPAGLFARRRTAESQHLSLAGSQITV